MSSLPEREAAVLWPTYARPPGRVRPGPGVRLWDARGREYLDFLGGIAVVAAGHAHPGSRRWPPSSALGHTSNLYFTGPQVELAERLVGHFGGDAKVFLSNSGAEANEAAIKVAACAGAGPTGATRPPGSWPPSAASTAAPWPRWPPPASPRCTPPSSRSRPGSPTSHLETRTPWPRPSARTPRPCWWSRSRARPGSGPAPGYLRAVRELTTRAGVLLIVDEIQSGMGRTGSFFAHQRDEIRPDVVTMAKALGSGYLIGATIARTEVADAMARGDHGTTFGGNPVACTAALATLDVIEPLLAGHVEKVSTRLADGP